MRSPIHPECTMVSREIEPGLAAYECPQSGGLWIPFQSYLAWRERQPAGATAAPAGPAPTPADDSHQRVLICPESGRFLLRYRVGHGLPFHLDRSPVTGGVWLDKGEWEALKSQGLHLMLPQIFTAEYQKQIRSDAYAQRLTNTFRERFGPADFAKVEDIRLWLAKHPKGRDICCYLLDSLEQRTGNGHPTGGATGQC